jgi:signal recognition particle receptor subunit beta
MSRPSRDAAEVNARIVYWGCEGAGKSANLRAAFAKLRPDHRGEIKQVPTRIDPTVGYEVLPIALGEIGGVRTQLELIAVPGHREQAPTRKQLLDQVDGIVFVADARAERAEANLASLRELRQGLAAYGRRLEQIPLVVQYNQRDLADPYAIEELHRRLGLGQTPIFEAVATQGSGVLQTLSTISKRVIRALRDRGPAEPEPAEPTLAEPELAAPSPRGPAPTQPAPRPAPREPAPPAPSPAERMERALLTEATDPDAAAAAATARGAEDLLAPAWESASGEIERPSGARIGPELTIVSVGEALRSGDREVLLPLVLGDASGQTSTLLLTLRLDALVEPGGDGGPV